MTRRTSLESRPSQVARIVALLRFRRGQWVPLSDILDLRPRISQFSARIWEARHRLGLNIENRTERVSGVKCSWFRLVETPSASSQVTVPSQVPLLPMPMSQRWVDPEEGGL